MGQNSQEVAYGFGQMGSAFHHHTRPIYPPKGHVIVAIQFLASNKLAVLETELMGPGGSQFITTETSESVENNYLGVTEAAAASATLTTVNFTDDTVQIADVITNLKIKPGQYVLLVNDSDTINVGLTVDGDTSFPVYNGPNPRGVKVVSVDPSNTKNITLSKAISPTSSQTLVFIDEQHGAGGTNITAGTVVFPKGLTIYGRWTMIQLGAADADGGIICYFGE